MPQEATSREDWRDRIERVRSLHRLEEYIERNGYPAVKRTEEKWKFHSPFPWRSDSTPSFYVYRTSQIWIDYGLSGDDRSGTIFDFMLQMGWANDFWDAVDQLDDGRPAPAQPVKREARRERSAIEEIPFDRVLNAADHYSDALPYWESQGMSRETVWGTFMGTDMDASLMGYRMGHKIKSGSREGRFISGKCKRFTIPDFRPNKDGKPIVVFVNSRRDDESAYAYLDFMKHAQREDVQAVYDDLSRSRDSAVRDYGREWYEIDDARLVNAIFGDKYLAWKPYNHIIFNGHILYDYETRRLRRLPYVIIVEAEKCARNLTEAGYPAIGIKPNSKVNIQKALAAVEVPYFAYDADTAGGEFALQMAELIGGKRLTLPSPYKDPTEVKIAGKLDTWLNAIPYCIYPLDLRDIAIPKWLRDAA